MAVDLKQLAANSAKHFGVHPDVIARAPGRVNLIGEHTDYNDGFVLPATVDFDVAVAATARSDRALRMFSIDYGQSAQISLDALSPGQLPLWAKYVAGVADQLIKAGHRLEGADMAIAGDVPRGSGLSSSAAIEMATMTALCELEGLDIGPVDRIKLAQKAENHFVGVPCGIMDQFISGLGTSDAALFIDCRSHEYRHVPLDLSKAKIVICDTQRKRTLAASAYAQRCKECAEGVERLRALLKRPADCPVKALRDVASGEFTAVEEQLPGVIRRRCRHIITENERVLSAMDALKAGDLAAFGRLMNASHASLRDDYEVSCEELNQIAEIGNATEGELGSRMTGAGFGGCTVHLVRAEAVEALRSNMTAKYYEPRGLKPAIYVCVLSPGACRAA